MKRKILSLILVLAFAVMMLPTVVSAEESGRCGYNLTWTLDDEGTLTISGTGEMSEYAELIFTPLFTLLNDENDRIKAIKIGADVESITDELLLSCTNLKSIEVDENNPNYCSVDGNLFSKDKTRLIRYSTGKYEEDNTYTVPDGVKVIEDSAFVSSELYVLNIPASVIEIEQGAFFNCRSMSIDVDENNPAYCSEEGVLFNKEKTVLIKYSSGYIRTCYKVPDGVERIENGAFSNSYFVYEVKLPDSVKSIGTLAFAFCDMMSTINIPEGVTEIGDAAFAFSGITDVSIPSTVKRIGDTAFGFSTQLEHADIAEGVTSIGEWAFRECRNLKSVQMPASVTEIGEMAFGECDNVTLYCYERSYAYDYARENNINVEKRRENVIVLDKEITSGKCGDNLTWELDDNGTLTISGTGDMAQFYDWRDYVQVYEDNSPWWHVKNKIKAVEITDGVTSISSYAFKECKNLESIKIPDSMKRIEWCAIFNCDKLESVKIPSGVAVIEEMTFAGNKGLKYVEISDGVEEIKGCAFLGCTSLININVDENNPEYCSIDGNLFSKDKKRLYQYALGKKESSYSIPDGVEMILAGAFSGSKYLESVEIPSTVKDIGTMAFQSCEKLKSVEIPYGVENMDAFAFGGCSELEKIIIPSSVIRMDTAFDYCNKLTVYCDKDSYAYNYAVENNIPVATITATAIPSYAKVIVDGNEISFDAYNINDNNYFKLRDLAFVLNGSAKQFGVEWNEEKNAINLVSASPYTAVGGEMAVGTGVNQQAMLTDSEIYKDNELVYVTGYNINNNNYFKLRDIAKLFDFCVTWDEATSTIIIDTTSSYKD